VGYAPSSSLTDHPSVDYQELAAPAATIFEFLFRVDEEPDPPAAAPPQHLALAYQELASLDVRGSVIELERITAYNPVRRQTNADPSTSSCGPNRPNQIALSRDLFFDEGRKHLCGVEAVLISVNPLSGEVVDVRHAVVFDTMSARFNRSADVFMPTTDESSAWAWGVKVGLLVLLDGG
jgi:hypothetical protein